MDSELCRVAGGGRGVGAPKFTEEAHVFGVADCGKAHGFGVVSTIGKCHTTWCCA